MASKRKYVTQSLLGDSTIKKVFGGSKEQEIGFKYTPFVKERKIKQLSPLANSVVTHCARLLATTIEQLQSEFEERAPPSARHPLQYARSLLEYCCFKALSATTQSENYLHDTDFRQFTFDIMVAWESPSASQPDPKGADYETQAKEEEDEDASLFFTDLMPLLASAENTVGIEAFVRIGPCITMLADIVTAHSQFETLTASTSGRLPFALYDKYMGALDKSVNDMKSKNSYSFVSNLPMVKGEHVIEVDGMSQTVIQHIGSKSSSGRLTLTDHALYFEASAVLSYHEATRFDFTVDLDHKILPDLTGPWGSRIFDKAITYKTSALPEPVVFEFPELTGATRREYWLAIIEEVVNVHKFIRKYELEGLSWSEAIARAVLGILHLQAIRECIQLLPPNPGSLLSFTLAEELPGGDLVLEALADIPKASSLDTVKEGVEAMCDACDGSISVPNSSAKVLCLLGVWKDEDSNLLKKSVLMYRIQPGELTTLEKAVKQSREESKHVQMAKATVEGVKVEGIGTNVAVLNEILKPVIAILLWIRDSVSWNKPFETVVFFIITSYIICRDWLGYVIPFLLAAGGVFIIWLRLSNRAKKYREIVVPTPSGGISLEQVVAVQRALSQVQGFIQAVNIVLLKIWALVLSASPRATNLLLLVLFGSVLSLALLPFRVVALAVNVAIFSSQFSIKTKESKLERRQREWWHSIPALPVRFVESEEEKKIQDSFQS